jgi:ParB family transcriptional regulator, chromosome partitioning protein
MLTRIPLSEIRPNPDQPRKLFEPKSLAELAASIRNNGLMQPITVRPTPAAGYEIVAGERRFRAHQLLAEQGQLPDGTILAHVRPMEDEQRDIEAIVENLSRADITPMEEARAFKRLLDRGMTEEALATKLGIQQTWRIRDRVRLLNLAPEHITLFEGGNLSAEAVYEISRLDRHDDQTRVVKMIGRGQLSGYKAIRAAVAAILDGLSQSDIFAGEPKASEGELHTINAMEAKIDSVSRMVAAGFRDGEVVVARKVSPDRARLMADRLMLIRKHCLHMENQLREAAAQAMLAVV